MPILEAQWSEALDPTIRHFNEIGFARRPSLLERLFNVQSSTNSDEQVGGIGAISVDAWDNLKNGKKVSQVDFNKGYFKTYTHEEYAVELEIERKFYDDNKYSVITNAAQRLGDSAKLKREYDRASMLNNAFSASFTGADAVALCSSSHPYGPDAAGSTQSNNFTLVLNKANLRTVREAMMAWTDDKSQKVAVTPDTLWVPPALEDTAREIIESPLDPASANNTVNPQFGRWTLVVDHYLSDTNAWFVMDSMLQKTSVDWFDRVPYGVSPKVMDTTLSSIWIAYMRYSFGFSDWRWIAGSNPS